MASGEHKIGIEIVNWTPLSYQMQPFLMSRDDARKLRDLLTEAVDS